jgi:hypothetical protein
MEKNNYSIRILTILIFLTYYLNISSQEPTINELRDIANMSDEDRTNAIEELSDETMNKINSQSDIGTYAEPYSYNPDELNFDRFKNSPCFDEIGFSPTWDTESLESKYSECENDKLKDKSSKILFVALFVIVVAVIAYFSIVQLKKKTKK